VEFYENSSVVRIEEGESHFVKPPADINNNPQVTEPSLNVKYSGELKLESPAIKKGDLITVTLSYTTSGMLCYAVHNNSGTEAKCEIISKHLLDSEKLAKEEKRIEKIGAISN
jgi:hypothetical protein